MGFLSRPRSWLGARAGYGVGYTIGHAFKATQEEAVQIKAVADNPSRHGPRSSHPDIRSWVLSREDRATSASTHVGIPSSKKRGAAGGSSAASYGPLAAESPAAEEGIKADR